MEGEGRRRKERAREKKKKKGAGAGGDVWGGEGKRGIGREGRGMNREECMRKKEGMYGEERERREGRCLGRSA